jgi:hypothetical protein
LVNPGYEVELKMKSLVKGIKEEEFLHKEQSQQQYLKDIFQNIAVIQADIVRYTGELNHYDESSGKNHIRENDKGDKLLQTIGRYKEAINTGLEKLQELHIPLDAEKTKDYMDWIYEDFPPSKIYSIGANIFNKRTEFDEVSDASKKAIYQSCIDYSEVIGGINKIFQEHNKIQGVEQ